jgi:hypothetical protein
MTTPDPNDPVEKHSIEANSGTTSTAEALPPSSASPIPAKAKEHNIRVSPAVLDAAGKTKQNSERARQVRTRLRRNAGAAGLCGS